jgi:hypothetical protein
MIIYVLKIKNFAWGWSEYVSVILLGVAIGILVHGIFFAQISNVYSEDTSGISRAASLEVVGVTLESNAESGDTLFKQIVGLFGEMDDDKVSDSPNKGLLEKEVQVESILDSCNKDKDCENGMACGLDGFCKLYCQDDTGCAEGFYCSENSECTDFYNAKTQDKYLLFELDNFENVETETVSMYTDSEWRSTFTTPKNPIEVEMLLSLMDESESEISINEVKEIGVIELEGQKLLLFPNEVYCEREELEIKNVGEDIAEVFTGKSYDKDCIGPGYAVFSDPNKRLRPREWIIVEIQDMQQQVFFSNYGGSQYSPLLIGRGSGVCGEPIWGFNDDSFTLTLDDHGVQSFHLQKVEVEEKSELEKYREDSKMKIEFDDPPMYLGLYTGEIAQFYLAGKLHSERELSGKIKGGSYGPLLMGRDTSCEELMAGYISNGVMDGIRIWGE